MPFEKTILFWSPLHKLAMDIIPLLLSSLYLHGN